MGHTNPLGFVMGDTGVWVWVDILLPIPNPYPSCGFCGFQSVWSPKLTQGEIFHLRHHNDHTGIMCGRRRDVHDCV